MTGQPDKDDAANAVANRIPRDQLDKLLALRAQLKGDTPATAEPPVTELARPPEG